MHPAQRMHTPPSTNLIKIGYTLSLLSLTLKSCLNQSDEHDLIWFRQTTG